MSVFYAESSSLTLRPRIWERGDSLHIADSWLLRILTLFIYQRHAILNWRARCMTVRERWFWFKQVETLVSFDAISHLDYTFHEMPTSIGFTSSGLGAQDSVEKFKITVVTKGHDSYEIGSFRGEGAKMTGWTGVILGDDDMYDLAGTQGSESRGFVNALAERLGVPIGRQYEFAENTIPCPACEMGNAPARKKCLYCGAEL